jgi:hypothetical protein
VFARTSTWSGSSEALGKWEAHVKDQVRGFVEKLPGNAGGAFFVDRAAGTAMTLTFWETEEAAAETDKFADQVRSKRPASSLSIAARSK